jgi:hypothetical protein
MKPYQIDVRARKFKLIICDIMLREACFCIARSRNMIDPVFMGKGLHNLCDGKMRELLQAEIDKVEAEKYDAILLGYGLCNNGTRDLHSPIPLIIPKAHDCITILLGSKEKYRDFFNKNPGTYYLSPGWIERNADRYEGEQSIPQQLGLATYEEYVAKYGEEDAQYIMETLGGGLQQYSKLAYIDTGVGDFSEYERAAADKAAQNGWAFEKLTGSCDLLQKLMDGDWPSAEFVIIQPGQSIKPTYGDEVLAAKDV